MRNLVEYPVTKVEIMLCLKEIMDDCDQELIGDMRPLLINEAIKHVRASKLKLSNIGTV